MDEQSDDNKNVEGISSSDDTNPEEYTRENVSGNLDSHKEEKSSVSAVSDKDEEIAEDYDPMATLSEKEDATQQSAENSKKIKKEKPVDDEFTKIVKQSRLQEERKKKRKKQIKWSVLGFLVVIAASYYMYLMTPYKGGMDYAVCRVFLERTLTFPSTLEVKAVEYPPNGSIRVWHMMTDSFGNTRMQPIQCYFQPNDGTTYLQLEKVLIQRREVDQEDVEVFNKTVPSIYKNPPDLSLPYLDMETLKNLHYDVNPFRKPIL